VEHNVIDFVWMDDACDRKYRAVDLAAPARIPLFVCDDNCAHAGMVRPLVDFDCVGVASMESVCACRFVDDLGSELRKIF
jgi:hypothetical protein